VGSPVGHYPWRWEEEPVLWPCGWGSVVLLRVGQVEESVAGRGVVDEGVDGASRGAGTRHRCANVISYNVGLFKYGVKYSLGGVRVVQGAMHGESRRSPLFQKRSPCLENVLMKNEKPHEDLIRKQDATRAPR